MEGLNSNKNLTKKKEKIVDMNASGFNLSDEEYRRELIEILKRLINYPTFLISGKELHQKNTDDILQKIATFSDAILINAKQNTVVIKNRLKLKSILKELSRFLSRPDAPKNRHPRRYLRQQHSSQYQQKVENKAQTIITPIFEKNSTNNNHD